MRVNEVAEELGVSVPYAYKFKAIAPYAAKRQVKIIKKSLTDKK